MLDKCKILIVFLNGSAHEKIVARCKAVINFVGNQIGNAICKGSNQRIKRTDEGQSMETVLPGTEFYRLGDSGNYDHVGDRNADHAANHF